MTPGANMDNFSPRFDSLRRDLQNMRRCSVKAAARVKNRAVSSAMPAANSSSFVRTLRNSFRRRKKPDLSAELENDENQNELDSGADNRDFKITIKSNETNNEMIVRTGMANYKCKFLGKKEVDGKSGIKYTDVALRSFKTLKEKKKQRMIIQVNPEVIRVVSAKDRTLLFDQAVDKISFCAPSSTYSDAFSYIARDGASQRWLCYCFSAKNNITGATLSKVFGEAFRACLENRQRLQKETGKSPIDVDMKLLPDGGFSRVGNGTFRQPRKQKSKEQHYVNIMDADDNVVSNEHGSGSSVSSPQTARARPAAPSYLIREASLRLPLKNQENMDLFKRSTSMRAYSGNTNKTNLQETIPKVKNWSDQLEAIKALNIQVHNATPIIEGSSPASTATTTPTPAWEPLDPFNELAKRPKQNPYGMIRPNPSLQTTPSGATSPTNINNNNPFVQLDREPNFSMKF